MSETTPSARRDWVVAGLFAAAAFALRVPFRSQLAYHWDSAQFALAIGDYDMTMGQPHAPGFFLYVLLGRLLDFLVGDPHASLVWLSVVAGASLPALGFLLGTAMFGRKCGTATGVVLATSPLCWFHSEVALTNIVDAALVTALMLACWRALRAGGTWLRVVAMSALYMAVAGVRLQSALALLPAFLWVWWQMKGWRWQIAVLTALFGALVFVPFIRLPEYWQLLVLKAQFDAPKTLWGGGLKAGWQSARVIVWSVWIGLLLAAPMTLIGWLRSRGTERIFLALWVGPLVALGVVAYTTMPGYALSYLPALAVLAGLGMMRLRSNVLATCVVGVTNTLIFVGTSYGLTARVLSEHDRALRHCFEVIRQNYRPEEAVIYHRGQFFFFGFRQFQLHLPEYRNVLLMSDASLPGKRGGKFWLAHEKRTEFIEPLEAPRARQTLLVVPPGEDVSIFKDRLDVGQAQLIEGTAGLLYVAD